MLIDKVPLPEKVCVWCAMCEALLIETVNCHSYISYVLMPFLKTSPIKRRLTLFFNQRGHQHLHRLLSMTQP